MLQSRTRCSSRGPTVRHTATAPLFPARQRVVQFRRVLFRSCAAPEAYVLLHAGAFTPLKARRAFELALIELGVRRGLEIQDGLRSRWDPDASKSDPLLVARTDGLAHSDGAPLP